MRSSINAALRIQNALLPLQEEIAKHLGTENFFILYQPRDVVSGDFYWFSQKKHMSVLAVADCTGHGVSGALISMLGMQILDKIVNENHIVEPHRILEFLHLQLTQVLKQKSTLLREGMDIAIITVQKLEKSVNLLYAGAMNPIYLVQNQAFQELKPDKKAIGGNDNQEKFTLQKHELPTNTTVYLCSDGYQDQFGGEKNKKFMVKNFKKLLFEISEKPMPEQKQILESTFEQWKGAEKQTDDVLVVGLRL